MSIPSSSKKHISSVAKLFFLTTTELILLFLALSIGSTTGKILFLALAIFLALINIPREVIH